MSVNLKIKLTPQNTVHNVTVDSSSSTIGDVKAAVASEVNIPAAEQRLIYRGRILQDTNSLESYSIGNDHVLLLIKSKPAGAAASPTASTTTTTTGVSSNPPAASTVTPTTTTTTADAAAAAVAAGTTSTNGAAGTNANATPNPFVGFPGMGMGGMGMDEAGRANMEQMMNNDPMMRQMSEQMMDQMASNPAMMDLVIQSNPQLREIIEANPELRRMMTDPEVLRRSMEMARDPALMREMMAQNDRAMANIQSMPGGFNAMASMYNDIQNPIQEALEGALDADDGTTTTGDANDHAVDEDGEPTSAPMPNPWGAGARPGATGAGARPAGAGVAGEDPMAAMMRMMRSTGPAGTGTGAAGTGTGAGANPFMGMGGMGGMGMPGGMDQESMRATMENPMMQAMMDNMMSNPEMMRSLMAMNPQTAHLVNDPMFNMMLSNPELMRSSMQMMRSGQYDWMMNPGAAGASGAPGAGAAGTGAAGTGANPYAAFMNPSASGASGADAANQQASFMNMMQMMNEMQGRPGAGAGAGAGMAQRSPMALSARDAELSGLSRNARENAAVMYAEQIQSIMGMGFTDTEAILSALIYTGGNVEAAIDRLFNSM